ncbi:MAG: hypothetical protein AB1473_09045 [Thermodesulfobacteriota bacterium]
MRKIVCALILGGLLLIGSVGHCQFPTPGLFDRPGQGWTSPENSIWGMIGAPTFHASWAFLGSITASASASAGVSQSFGAGNPAAIGVFGNFGIGGNGEAKLRTDTRGLWLGATIPVRLSNALAVSARGEYFFPSSRRITASLNGGSVGQATSTLFILAAPVGTVTAAGTGQGELELDASVEKRWVVLDGELAYAGLLGGTSLLAGVRYDHLDTTIGPEVGSGSAAGSLTIATAFGGGSLTIAGAAAGSVSIPAAASVVTELHTLSPYLGIRTSIGGPSAVLTLEVKGFPTVFFTQGARFNLKRENGYFGEFKAEYSGPLARNLLVSLFVKGDVLHASFTDLTDFTNLFTIGGVGLPAPFSLGSPNVATDVATSIHWNQLSLGGSFVVSF